MQSCEQSLIYGATDVSGWVEMGPWRRCAAQQSSCRGQRGAATAAVKVAVSGLAWRVPAPSAGTQHMVP